MNEYLSFRKMITPALIQVLFWIGAVFCVISGLAMIVGGANSSYGGGGQVLAGFFMLTLGPISVRVYCELIIVVFRMHELLTRIRSNTEKTEVDSVV